MTQGERAIGPGWRVGYLSRFAEVATACVAVALVAGFAYGLISGGGSGGKDSGSTAMLDVGDLVFSDSAGWTRTKSLPPIPGLTLSRQNALAGPLGEGSAGLVAGLVKGPEGAMLPPELLANLRTPPSPEVVGLVGADAYRYAGLEVPGFPHKLTVYAVPTSSAAVLAACYGDRPADRVRCELIVSTLDAVQSYPLTPDPRYGGRVVAAINRLDAARRREQPGLDSHRSEGQAAIASRLSRAYRAAADDLARRPAPEVAQLVHQRVVSALRDGAAAYDGLATAARREAADPYARASRDLAAADADVNTALADLATLGYGRGEKP